MAGHSKWANIKHRKEKQDEKKGKLFSKLSKMIAMAAKEKDGDPEKNPDLSMAVEKAKDANMPKENIQRAIKRGTGELEGVDYSPYTLEAFGPDGVGFVVFTVTDNKNRTISEIRSLLDDFDGSLAQKGAVSWKFKKRGKFVVKTTGKFKKDELLEKIISTDAGSYDELDKGFLVYTPSSKLHQVKEELEKEGVKTENADFVLLPKQTVKIEDEKKAERILKLAEKLEDHQDVESVYSDFDIPDRILDELGD